VRDGRRRSPDVALMKRVGWPIAVANAQPEVK
jgi:hydroxymethylpyrimidine pyrophosphatase-like HAD family hydrolase